MVCAHLSETRWFPAFSTTATAFSSAAFHCSDSGDSITSLTELGTTKRLSPRGVLIISTFCSALFASENSSSAWYTSPLAMDASPFVSRALANSRASSVFLLTCAFSAASHSSSSLASPKRWYTPVLKRSVASSTVSHSATLLSSVASASR